MHVSFQMFKFLLLEVHIDMYIHTQKKYVQENNQAVI